MPIWAVSEVQTPHDRRDMLLPLEREVRGVIRKVLLVSLTCLVVGTACGKSGADPLSLIKGSSARAVSAKTAKITMSVTASAAGQSFSLDGTGAADFSAKAVQFSFDFGKMFEGLGGSPPPGMPTTFEFVYAGTSMYFKAPPGAKVAQNKPWLKVEIKDLTGVSGTQSFSSDPRGFLDALKGLSAVTKSGTEKVRGVDTTTYKGSIDVQKALEGVPSEKRDEMSALLKQYGATAFPVTVWVGADGLVYRILIQQSLQGLGTADVKLEFFDYGKPVNVRVPSESESTEVTPEEFMQLLSL